MKTVELGRTGLQVPAVGLGCMRMADKTPEEAARVVATALERGVNFFDHADIYGGGASEERFAGAVRDLGVTRDKLILQSKCGIRPGVCYDFSLQHIIRSVEGSLTRLGTDYLDVLLLHRPDALMVPEEVAEAFRQLKAAGKVRHFGVSNMNPGQMALLGSALDEPLAANQLQLSITHAGMIRQGLHVNTGDDAALDRDGGALDYCRLKKITVQPWSPLQYAYFTGPIVGSDKFAELNRKLDELALAYDVAPTAIAIAWLLRHPADMQPIVGTMNPDRLGQCVDAVDVRLTREEWYAVYLAAGNELP